MGNFAENLNLGNRFRPPPVWPARTEHALCRYLKLSGRKKNRKTKNNGAITKVTQEAADVGYDFHFTNHIQKPL